MTPKQKVRATFPKACSYRLNDWTWHIRRKPKDWNGPLAWGYNPQEAWRNASLNMVRFPIKKKKKRA